MKRGIRLTLVLLLVVAAAGVGWVAGAQIKSPAQIAAETAPPEPSLIAVPVEMTRITNDVITRGTVRFQNPTPISADSVVLTGLDPVVTQIPEVGDTLEEGDVLYEIAGRPTFVLQGELPLFRTVNDKDKGEDIAQLQESLVRLGFYEEEVDGVYGRSTERAVRDMYEAAGYEPYKPTGQSRYPVPQTEILFFDSLPIRVDDVMADRGDLAAGEIMAVSESRLLIESSIDAEDAEFVSVGQKVTIDLASLDVEISGTVTTLADLPGTNDLPPDRVYMEVTPDEERTELNAANVRIVIPVESRSTSEEVLAVPAAALSAVGSGNITVTVLEDGDITRTVVVEPGLATSSGLVEITPVDEVLDETDWVVVGIQTGEQ